MDKLDLSKLPTPAQQVVDMSSANSVPTELVPLPSRGKVYPPESPLANLEALEIRAMTAKDEDILTSRALLKQGKAIDALLRNCIVNKALDIDSMLTGDRNAILVGIRMTGYGPEYKVKTQCPKCDEFAEQEFDLSTIPLKMLDAEPLEPNTNRFFFTLPMSKKNVEFRLPTGADDRAIADALDKMRKKSGAGSENLVTGRLHHQIVSIDGEDDRNKLLQLVRNMSAKDSRDLRKFMDSISPGIEMKQIITCGECTLSSEVDVPMGTEFFWPSGN